MVFAVREPNNVNEFTGLPQLVVGGLADGEARSSLLASAMPGRLDERVRDQIVAETRGNPLALLELPRGLTPAELAGGFGVPDARPLASRVEETFVQRVRALPRETQRLLLLAAAEPVGDVSLLWRAAERLGIRGDAGRPAEGAALIELGIRVRFRHPLVRSAPTGPLTFTTARKCIERWPRRPIRIPIPIVGRGIGRKRRPGPTRRWPMSWSARPTGRRPVGARRRLRRFSARGRSGCARRSSSPARAAATLLPSTRAGTIRWRSILSARSPRRATIPSRTPCHESRPCPVFARQAHPRTPQRNRRSLPRGHRPRRGLVRYHAGRASGPSSQATTRTSPTTAFEDSGSQHPRGDQSRRHKLAPGPHDVVVSSAIGGRASSPARCCARRRWSSSPAGDRGGPDQRPITPPSDSPDIALAAMQVSPIESGALFPRAREPGRGCRSVSHRHPPSRRLARSGSAGSSCGKASSASPTEASVP